MCEVDLEIIKAVWLVFARKLSYKINTKRLKFFLLLRDFCSDFLMEPIKWFAANFSLFGILKSFKLLNNVLIFPFLKSITS